MSPTTIAHYRVTAKIGAGGMGEVYRATDTKLGRDVAIKVLPPAFAGDKERLARFGREAQVLASLSHPNIAAIYGLEDSDDTKALVLELVEGDTLGERLRRGPLPVEEALEVCAQIAEALEAAHEKGIIHRDLKPGNVKLTPDGKVKVLDFGLAKLVEDGGGKGPQPALEDSPTITANYTSPGTILGTAAYMSPEQAKGKPVDKRTDIWSFGCVLYECLTGKRVFAGETATDSIGAVLHKEPDWTPLPPATPASIQLLLRKCLAKDRKHRLHDIADARVDLEHALADPGTSSMRLAGAAVAEGDQRRRKRMWLAALPWALAVAGVAFAFYRNNSSQSGGPSAPAPIVQTYTINLRPDAPLATAAPLGSSIVVSPDCSKVVYLGQRDGIQELFWKSIGEAEFRPIPDAVKAFPSVYFSPESDRVAFWTEEGELKVFTFEGGQPRKIHSDADRLVTLGAQWGPNNRLVYANAAGIFSISAKEGSTPELLIARDRDKGDPQLLHPQYLPGSKNILFTVKHTNGLTSLESFDLMSKARKPIDLKGSYNPVYYPPTGHLLYGRDDVMWAHRFDPVTLAFVGPEISLLKDLGRDWSADSHQFSIARNGTLIYARGHQAQPRHQLVWVKAQGVPEPLPLDPGTYYFPRIAPDGRSLIFRSGESKQFLMGLPNGVPVELGGVDGSDIGPAYDGTHFYFNQRVGPSNRVMRVRVDGTGQPVEINPGEGDKSIGDVSADGKLLALVQNIVIGQRDIWIKETSSQDKAQPFVNTTANEVGPKFSPDGRWLAYTANTTDRYEVYVKKVREGGLPVRLSKGGGSNPVWSRDGRRIYYRNANGIMVVKLKAGDSTEFEEPSVFATGRFVSSGVSWPANYDVFTAEDGDRLLMVKSAHPEPEPQYATQVTVIVHFDEHIRQQEAGQSKRRGAP